MVLSVPSMTGCSPPSSRVTVTVPKVVTVSPWVVNCRALLLWMEEIDSWPFKRPVQTARRGRASIVMVCNEVRLKKVTMRK
jgi:hypothetical protein